MTNIIHMHDYDVDFHPSMPVIEIGLSAPEDQQPTIFLTAQVDSGADATFIPSRIFKKMGLSIVDTKILRGVTGRRRMVNLYQIVV
ncbi:MAG: hypothetical protein AAF639_08795 [Chloroflexota bacterium]